MSRPLKYSRTTTTAPGRTLREIVLLTAQETITFSEIVDLINETTGRNVQLKLVSRKGNRPVRREVDGRCAWIPAHEDGEGIGVQALTGYTSLAFGGYSSDSKAAVQESHLMTEEMMKQ
jgi:hypothetical protein